MPLTKAAASLPCQALTHGPAHHFFGYYDRCPYSPSGRYLLALEVDFSERPPRADDVARIGVIDLQGEREFEAVAETTAWNFQQGAMQQWLPGTQDQEIIYNIRTDDHYASCIHNIDTGQKRTLSRPVYVLNNAGTGAVTVNFARLDAVRPGYGYKGLPDPWADDPAPADDGIYYVDPKTGDSKLIVSTAEIAAIEPTDEIPKAVHWFNHLLFSPADERIVFLHRLAKQSKKHSEAPSLSARVKGWLRQTLGGQMWLRRFLSAHPALQEKLVRPSHLTRMFTVNTDGTDLYLLNPDDMTSHFDWRDDKHILAWARQKGQGDHYYLFEDRTDNVQTIGKQLLVGDGHCTYSQDGRFILTDTYPRGPRNERGLILYDTDTEKRIDLGQFYSPPDLKGEIRCDLHPRWNRDSTKVCFDSVHEGARQMYEIDVTEIVANPEAAPESLDT